jgi:hypothetical protein
MNDNVFVFKLRRRNANDRYRLWAVPRHAIQTIETQMGSQNVYLLVNGVEVEGSFDEFIKQLGTRIDVT